MNFYFIQLIGLVAWILLAFSYYRKDTNHILMFQIVSTLLFCMHYYLLGAYSGLLICIYEVIRDYLYYKSDKDNYIFIGCVIIYAISAIVTYTSLLDLFPYTASIIDGFFLTKKRVVVVFGAIITYTIWLIYDFHAKSYSGVITDITIKNSFITHHFSIY